MEVERVEEKKKERAALWNLWLAVHTLEGGGVVIIIIFIIHNHLYHLHPHFPLSLSLCRHAFVAGGVPLPVLFEAIDQADEGRQRILSVMESTVSTPAFPMLKSTSPRLVVVHCSTERIGNLMGTMGRMKRAIEKEHQCVIEVAEVDDERSEVRGSLMRSPSPAEAVV